MADSSDVANGESPSPDPALWRLDRLVGTWKLNGRPLGADRDTISGTTSFAWLHEAEGRGFFLQQDMDLDYDGTLIRSHELIGYDPGTKAFASQVYSNMAADPWPYRWDVRGDEIMIAISHGAMNAAFTGRFSSDGRSFAGGWRPNPGADEAINAPYDIVATRMV